MSGKIEAIEDMNGLIQMYQAGFVDGYRGKRKDLKEINKKCRKAFDKRFSKKLDKKIK